MSVKNVVLFPYQWSLFYEHIYYKMIKICVPSNFIIILISTILYGICYPGYGDNKIVSVSRCINSGNGKFLKTHTELFPEIASSDKNSNRLSSIYH